MLSGVRPISAGVGARPRIFCSGGCSWGQPLAGKLPPHTHTMGSQPGFLVQNEEAPENVELGVGGEPHGALCPPTEATKDRGTLRAPWRPGWTSCVMWVHSRNAGVHRNSSTAWATRPQAHKQEPVCRTDPPSAQGRPPAEGAPPAVAGHGPGGTAVPTPPGDCWDVPGEPSGDARARVPQGRRPGH